MRWFLVVTLVLAGCSSPGPLIIDSIKSTEVRLTSADEVNIAIAEADRNRVDRYVKSFFGEHEYGVATGIFWQRAFKGSSDTPQLRVTSAVLTESIDGGGFTIRYTYAAKCELSYGGMTYKINAEGTRAAAMFTLSAMRQAIELGVTDAAKKAKTIVASLEENWE